MTTHLVTFSDESMSRAAELCVRSAARVGGVDDSLRWYYQDFQQTDCYAKNYNLLSQPRGLGYWAWKPQITDWAMRGLMTNRQFIENSFCSPKDGDTLIYADAGIEFIAPVQHIIDRMDQDVWLFSNMWEHSHWCKGDAMRAVFPDGKWEDFGKQVQASVIFFSVTDFSRRFVKEWLDLCLTPGLIDDSPSVTPNHEQFAEHRHDQALLTCLAHKYGIKKHWWPAVYNRFTGPEFVYEKGEHIDTYPPLFHHHRLRDHEWPTLLGQLWANLHPKYYK